MIIGSTYHCIGTDLPGVSRWLYSDLHDIGRTAAGAIGDGPLHEIDTICGRGACIKSQVAHCCTRVRAVGNGKCGRP